jgi:RNA ligase
MKQLILMVGSQGSGKTTYCEKNLPGYLRISQDDQGKNEHAKLFDEAIARGEPLVVVDRINAEKYQRGRYLVPARKEGYRTKIVWLTTDKAECLKRCRNRKGHPTLKPEDAEQAINMYFSRLQAPSRREADELEVIGPPPYFVPVSDVREDIGTRNYLVVGDVHGCFDELKELMDTVGFNKDEDVLVCVGDLIDRGPKIKEVIDLVRSLPRFFSVMGNHEEKMLRLFRGSPVKIAHGLQKTVDSFGGKIPEEVADWVRKFPLILRVPDGYVVHGGFDPLKLPEEQNKADCIYMRYYGGANYFDSQGGTLWYKLWPQESPRVFFGHDPHPDGPCYNNIFHLDGGCVFGNYLKGWWSKDKIVYYVTAKEKYSVSEMEALATSPNDEVKRREEYVIGGLLRGDRTDDGELAIYTYTDQCTFERSWDNITMNSRGHVFNVKTGECVARPFAKFFNLGERPDTNQEKLPWDKPYEVFEKLDGWLGVLYRHNGKYHVASRGSFHSDGSKWASQFIQTKDMSFLPDDVTLVFEIVTPEQKIILDYKGEKTLYVLAAFNRNTGDEYPRSQVEEWASKAGLPVVPKHESLKIDDCLKIAKEMKGREGFVIRFENGLRVKVKTDWYCHLAKIMVGLSPISIWECMKNGKVPGERIREIPEELRALSEQYRDKLEQQYSKLTDAVMEVVTPLVNKYRDRGDRKAFALEVNKLPPLVKFSAFQIADKKSIDELIMERIYPKSNNWVDVDMFIKEMNECQG